MKILAMLAASLLFGLAGAVCARAADVRAGDTGSPAAIERTF